MAANVNELNAVLSAMEEAVKSLSEMDAQVLDFVDANYSNLLDDQKLVQMFKDVTDAEDELQRQLGLLRKKLAAGIPELKALGG